MVSTMYLAPAFSSSPSSAYPNVTPRQSIPKCADPSTSCFLSPIMSMYGLSSSVMFSWCSTDSMTSCLWVLVPSRLLPSRISKYSSKPYFSRMRMANTFGLEVASAIFFSGCVDLIVASMSTIPSKTLFSKSPMVWNLSRNVFSARVVSSGVRL